MLSAHSAQTSMVLGQKLGDFQLTERLLLAPGEIFATTIRRFKGLEHTAIVLCEVDGQMATEDIEAIMYVGTSRAKAYLVVLMKESAPEFVRQSLQPLMKSEPTRL